MSISNQNSCSETHAKFNVRYFQFVILFLCVTVSSVSAVSGIVTILAMTDSSIHKENIQVFDWDKFLQGIILSSAGWGNIITQLSTGILIFKYGAKNVLTFSFLAITFFLIFQPFSAYYGGWKGFCACKILQGIFSGFVWPCMHSLLGRWAPLNERSRSANYVYSGMYIGNIIGGPMAGLISTTKLGWPWVYYFSGILTFVISILVKVFLENSPADHKTISEYERKYIEESLNQQTHKKMKHVPWKSIITSVPVWALIFAQTGAFCGFAVISYEMPTYFNNALGIDLQSSGLLVGFPYLASFIVTMTVSTVADFIVNKDILSLTTVRKVCNSLGLQLDSVWTVLPAMFMFIIVTVQAASKTLAVVTMIVIFGTDAINCTGFFINHIDISPRYAGVLLSFTNFISNLILPTTPIITGWILNDPTDPSQWRTVFGYGALLYFFGNLIFVIWGTAVTQPWDDDKTDFEIESPTCAEMKPLKKENAK